MNYRLRIKQKTDDIRQDCDLLNRVGQSADVEVTRLEQENEQLRERIKELESDDPPPSGWDVEYEHQRLVDSIGGYAGHWGVTGGTGGDVYVVSSLSELRELADKRERCIIIFNKHLNGNTWRMTRKSHGIKVRDDKTIWCVDTDGNKVDLTIIADWRGSGGAFVCNDDNVIISDITGKFGRAPRDDDGPDFIQINRPAEGIAINRLDFTGTGEKEGPKHGDGVVDCYGVATLQNSHIRDARKCHLVKGRGKFSILNTRWDNCGGRVPHVGDDATAHVDICTVDGTYWDYAMIASENGTLYVTNTEFRHTKRYAIRIRNYGEWHGYNVDMGGAKNDRRESDKVNVPYDY